MVRNANHQRPDLRLFELGKVYQHRQNADAGSENAAQRYEETERLAIFMTGASAPENWNNASGSVDAYALKNEVDNLLASLGISPSAVRFPRSIFLDQRRCRTDLRGPSHRPHGQGALLSRAKPRGQARRLLGGLDGEAADQDLGPVECQGQRAGEVSRCTPRSLVDPQGRHPVRCHPRCSDEGGEKLLKRVGLFDIYEGKNLEPGHVSYAVSLVLQDEEKP